MSAAAAKISVIVPCRNEVRHIRAFLESLLAQDLKGLYWEAIIAEGMSDDGTREIVGEYSRQDPRIRVIENRGRNVSSGLNEAIRAARGEITVRMDVHTEYAPDYVRRCVEVLEETGADNVGGPWMAHGAGYVGRAIGAAFQSPIGSGAARSRWLSYEGPADTVYLGCWRKSTLERVGLFDETLVRNQDDELNLRIVRAGGTVWQSPRIRSWYHPRDSLKKLFRQYFQYGFWKVAVIRKHRLPASWRHVLPGAAILMGLALPAAAALGRAAGSATGSWLVAIWTALVALYSAAVGAASVLAARGHGWDLLPVLPLVFATYHVSYGLGFVAGLLYFPFRAAKPEQTHAVFTGLSR